MIEYSHHGEGRGMGRLRALLERQTLDHDPLAAVLFGHLWDGAPLDGLILSNTKDPSS